MDAGLRQANADDATLELDERLHQHDDAVLFCTFSGAVLPCGFPFAVHAGT